MGTPYLMDTNAVVDYLKGKLPASSVALIDEHIIEISVITRIELLA
jgi:predicted nucleic acid-binding protein